MLTNASPEYNNLGILHIRIGVTDLRMSWPIICTHAEYNIIHTINVIYFNLAMLFILTQRKLISICMAGISYKLVLLPTVIEQKMLNSYGQRPMLFCAQCSYTETHSLASSDVSVDLLTSFKLWSKDFQLFPQSKHESDYRWWRNCWAGCSNRPSSSWSSRPGMYDATNVTP